MTDSAKTNQELIEEIAFLKHKIHELETSGSGCKQMNEVSGETENRLHTILQETHALLASVDINGHFTYANDATARVVGYSRAEELIGKSYLHFVHLEDRPRVLNTFINQVNRLQQSSIQEFRITDTKGKVKWVSFLSSLIIRDGRVVGQTGVAQDITEYKRVERFLQDVIYKNPMSIQILDKDGLTLEVNPSYKSLFGSVPPTGYSMFSDPQLLQLGMGKLFDQLREGEIVRFPDTYFNAHDSISEFPDVPAWIRTLGFPLNDSNEMPERFVLMHENITERKQAEGALRENEEHLSSIFRSAPIGIGLVANRVLKSVNSRLCEITGYNEVELIGQSSRILYPNDEDFEFVGREKYAQIKNHGTGTVETRWQRKDGAIIEVLLSSTPIDLRDHSKGVTFTALDITDRKQVEADLRAERQYLTDIIDFLPDATFIIDTDKRVVVWNRAAEEMTGVPREALLGKGDYAYAAPFYGERRPILIDLLNISEEERESSYSYVNRVGDKVYAETFIQTLKNGEGAYLWGVAAPLYDRTGLRTGAVEVIKDITELKRSEKANIQLHSQLMQAQKMEAIGQLAGGVAHDFNNMLGVIIGYSELILAQIDPSHQIHPELEEIQKAAHRSADLTRQLLTFARKQTVAPKVLDLNQTVEGMLNMLRRLIGENIHLIWMPGNTLWPIKMDPSQIDQILANLCVNARDAIAGVGKITVETENTPLNEEYCGTHAGFIPGEYVRIAVSDTGNGMDEETLAHIFEPFFTTKGVGEGTGLGLATVYGAVKQNNGFINAFSEPGRGTTFTIYLPRYIDKVLPATRTVAADSIPSGAETILLVEDEPMILKMTTQMLAGQGYHVLGAASPREAIRLAKENAGSIDLLMTDVIMPEMNGLDLANKLLVISPNIKRLFMSGYTASVIEPHGVLEEGSHFIQKPFNRHDLATAIRVALDS